MFVVLDKCRLSRLIAITRDDRRPSDQGRGGPFYRIEASSQTLRLSGRQVEVTIPATLHEPGVIFLRVTLFRRCLKAIPLKGFISIQADAKGLALGDTEIPASLIDMLLYPEPSNAPAQHPTERNDWSERDPPTRPPLFGGALD
ncbi:MAG: hypothetical protein AMXMBFR58_36100 [Phycisphaerae bacterium]